MANEFRIFKVDHQITTVQLRRSGIVLLLVGLSIAALCAAMLALAFGVSVPTFLLPDSIRIDPQPNQETASIGLVLFLSSVTAFGLVT